MKRIDLLREAKRFRNAIEMARDAGDLTPMNMGSERMNRFPDDCCDDTADLFTHYLYHKFGIESIRVDGHYYNYRLRCSRGHSWQKTEGWLIDLTGDQFDNDPVIPIKAPSIYVGKMGGFHRQFEIKRQERSCGIECLGDDCKDRMYWLYSIIMKHI